MFINTCIRVIRYIVFIFGVAMTSALAHAADPEIFSDKTNGAIRGTDVVAYYSLPPGAKAIKGKDEFSYIWRDTIWKFSSAENRQRFIDSPEAYAPQYGGYCAFATSLGFTTFSRPNSWTIVDGKLYLNNNMVSRRKFQKEPAQYIADANSNWPDVLKKCEERNKCRKPFDLDKYVEIR